MSVAAALTYYESVGQNWERAALIKARPVAGDRAAGAALSRRAAALYLAQEPRFRGDRRTSIRSSGRSRRTSGGGQIAVDGHDIKLGRGGIREIEFFAQTQQLIWGGRLRELRVGPTCDGAAPRSPRPAASTPATADALIADYRFLRRVEHRLQMVDDAQTHRLPADRDGIARLAVFLGYRRRRGASSPNCAPTSASVERHYAELFEEAPSLAGPGNLVFTGTEDDPETLATLARLGFAEPARGRGDGARLASRPHPRDAQPAGARNPDRARAGAAAHLRRHRRIPIRRCGASTSSCRGCRPGCSCSRCSTPIPACCRWSPTSWPRRRCLAESLAQRPALLDAVLTRRVLRAAAAIAPGSPPISAALLAGRARFRGHARPAAALGQRAAVPGRRPAAAPRPRRRRAPAPRSPTSPRPRSRRCCRRSPPISRGGTAQVPGGAFAIVAMGRLGSREMTPRLRPRPDPDLRRAGGSEPARTGRARWRSRPITRGSASG